MKSRSELGTMEVGGQAAIFNKFSDEKLFFLPVIESNEREKVGVGKPP